MAKKTETSNAALWGDLYRGLVSGSPRWPAALLAGYALFIQIGAAKLLGVSADAKADRCTVTAYPSFLGHGYSAWGFWWLILPTAWIAYRFMLREIVGVDTADSAPAIAELAKSTVSPIAASRLREQLWHLVYGWRPILIAAVIATVLNVLDLTTVILPYWNHAPVCLTAEPDWSVMALAGKGTTATANWIFNILAYLQQWIASVLALHLIGAIFLHHGFFLKKIYCTLPQITLNGNVPINLEDEDGSSGLKNARSTFNYAIVFSLVCGLVTIWSRFDNTKAIREELFNALERSGVKFEFTKEGVAAWYFDAIGDHFADLFPDIGQWILLLLWISMSFILTGPIFLKYLPIVRGLSPGSASEYVRAFLPKSTALGEKTSRELTTAFRSQSFWPAGEAMAKVLLTLYSFATINMIFPAAHLGHLRQSLLIQLILFLMAMAVSILVWKTPNFLLRMKFPALGKDEPAQPEEK